MNYLSLPEFGDKVTEIMPVILRQLISKQQDEVLKGKITPAQVIILDFLEKKGESKMSELAHFMEVTTAAMTGIIDRLVRDSYCIRVYEPQDRRIIKIKLNEKGKELIKRIRRQRRQMIIRIFSKISEAERGDYLKVLKHVQQILTQEEAASHG